MSKGILSVVCLVSLDLVAIQAQERRRPAQNVRDGAVTIAHPGTNRLSGPSECRFCLYPRRLPCEGAFRTGIPGGNGGILARQEPGAVAA